MNSLYDVTLPVFVKSLGALDSLLEKAQAFVAEKGLDEKTLLEARIAPDMFPFKKQVQIVCDNAKGASARLAGVEVPSHEDNEETLSELRARIKKTQDFLATVAEDSFKEAATRQITLAYFPGKYMTGFDYTREYVLPNFFFHLTTAYDLLRQAGMAIGKTDFLGGSLPLRDL
jgi:hypothetical protein